MAEGTSYATASTTSSASSGYIGTNSSSYASAMITQGPIPNSWEDSANYFQPLETPSYQSEDTQTMKIDYDLEAKVGIMQSEEPRISLVTQRDTVSASGGFPDRRTSHLDNPETHGPSHPGLARR